MHRGSFIAEKNSKAAFEVICALFLKFGKVGIDDSYGTVYTLFAPIMEYFAQVVELMDWEEKDKAFAWVENHIDDEKILPHIRDYFFEAYVVLFNDEKSLRKKIIFFDSYLEKNYSSENLNDYKNSYELQHYAKKRLNCMEELKCPKEEIIAFCKKYEKINELSEILAGIYMSNCQYAEAEKVYLQLIAETDNYSSEEKYRHKLLDIYKATNNTEKQKPIIKELFFDKASLDLAYYNEYKSFFSESEWEKEFASMINQARNEQFVEELLFEEEKIEELFEYISKRHKNGSSFWSPITYSLNKYGKYFEPDHSAQVVQMYAECLDLEMASASTRSNYAGIAGGLKSLMRFSGGKKAALELKEKWFVKYKNRSAMKDELNKIL